MFLVTIWLILSEFVINHNSDSLLQNLFSKLIDLYNLAVITSNLYEQIIKSFRLTVILFEFLAVLLYFALSFYRATRFYFSLDRSGSFFRSFNLGIRYFIGDLINQTYFRAMVFLIVFELIWILYVKDDFKLFFAIVSHIFYRIAANSSSVMAILAAKLRRVYYIVF